jgi:hypothetical protein
MQPEYTVKFCPAFAKAKALEARLRFCCNVVDHSVGTPRQSNKLVTRGYKENFRTVAVRTLEGFGAIARYNQPQSPLTGYYASP